VAYYYCKDESNYCCCLVTNKRTGRNGTGGVFKDHNTITNTVTDRELLDLACMDSVKMTQRKTAFYGPIVLSFVPLSAEAWSLAFQYIQHGKAEKNG